jgi:hypothetical protein
MAVRYIRKSVNWVKNDRIKSQRWTRAFLAWFGAMGSMLVGPGINAAINWSLQDWGKRLLVAGIFGIVGAINLGDKNAEPPQQPPN